MDEMATPCPECMRLNEKCSDCFSQMFNALLMRRARQVIAETEEEAPDEFDPAEPPRMRLVFLEEMERQLEEEEKLNNSEENTDNGGSQQHTPERTERTDRKSDDTSSDEV